MHSNKYSLNTHNFIKNIIEKRGKKQQQYGNVCEIFYSTLVMSVIFAGELNSFRVHVTTNLQN